MFDDLKKNFSGSVDTSDDALEAYSHDASLFELRPSAVLHPKDSADIQAAVRFVNKHKATMPELSLTPRSAGTDMSGGAINTSLIIDMTSHFNKVLNLTTAAARVQPGVFFRDFDKKTIEKNVLLPSYPASRDLATVGGMASNNSGGEKSLRYGKTANYVTELKVVLADGNEYTIKPLKKDELVRKMSEQTFEGKLYKETFELLEKHYDEIQAAKPHVSKDSTGYHLWDVWNRESGVFDLTKLFVGAQGTLGIITEIEFKLVPREPLSGVLVCYMKDVNKLGDVIPEVVAQHPETFESFDDNTLWLSFRFFPSFIKKLGFKLWLKTALQLIPDALALSRGIPKLILMIEFTGSDQADIDRRIDEMARILKHDHMLYVEKDDTIEKSKKFWLMRRESFNLLRSKVHDKHTAPFIDDFVVPPNRMPEFWPRIRKIIKKYKLLATIAGHMGDGNFHVIPLMKIEDPKERRKLQPAMKEVNNLVLKYGGSISGEHNDGLVRGPWLEAMYGKKVLGYMKEAKHIFDPENIFNPHKKTDASWGYSFSHIREKF
jgi:FAD/FMN-containing dehydrogenase